MLGKLLLPEVRDLIASGDEQTLSEILSRWSPADVVELFDAISDEEDLAGMKMMPGPQCARVDYCPKANQDIAFQQSKLGYQLAPVWHVGASKLNGFFKLHPGISGLDLQPNCCHIFR
jgi:hypothetical protein